MKNKNADDIIQLINTCIELIDWIKKKNNSGEVNENLLFLKEIESALESIENIENNYTEKIRIYCKNIKFSIKKVEENLTSLALVVDLEILPLLHEIRKILIFAYEIDVFDEKKEEYYKKREFLFGSYDKTLINKEYKYKVSIVLTAYNKLEYTKKAVESIYKYTDFEKLNVELITVNNGSTDGTEEYFNSLPNEKKINFKHNMLGNNVSMYSIEGEYWVGFANDVVATPNWLENLLVCMQENPRVVYAVPTCNEDGISAYQGVEVDYDNNLFAIDEIEKFAMDYNKESKPGLWEERCVLIPFMAIFDSGFTHYLLKNDVELFDCHRYVQYEFSDDDFSTSLRRAGLKQLLLKDTFLHHFGSVTLGEARKDNSLGNMRAVYYKKWGIDAWDSRGYFPNIEKLICPNINNKSQSLLFIEPKFGGTTLSVKNHLKKKNIKIDNITAIVIDDRYLLDVKFMYDKVISSDNLSKTIGNHQSKYDLITFGVFIHELEIYSIIDFLESLYDILEDNGQIIFMVKNHRNTKTIINLLQNNIENLCEYNKMKFTSLDFNRLRAEMDNNEKLNSYRIHSILEENPYTESLLNFDSSYNDLSMENKQSLNTEFSIEYHLVSIDKNKKQ